MRHTCVWLLLLACGASAPPSATPPSGAGEGEPCGLGDPRTTASCAAGLSCCGGPTSPNISEANGYAGWCAHECPATPVAQ